MTSKVFVSYSSVASVDEELAQQVKEILDGMEVQCYLYRDDMRLGGHIPSDVEEEIRESSVIVVIVSPASLKSDWVLFEVGYARALGKTVVPFLEHPSLELPPYMRELRHTTSMEDLQRYFEENFHKKAKPSTGPKAAAAGRPAEKQAGLVLVVGGTNGEYALQLSANIEIGHKHEVKSSSLLGGSGVNHTLRLLNAGIPVVPILAVGDDDLGREIQHEISLAARKVPCTPQILSYIKSSDFLVRGMKTPRSTIVVHKDSRTIFKESLEGAELFFDYLKHRIDELSDHLLSQLRAVIIGHIPADVLDIGDAEPGQCTRYIIRRFARECPVFANFGGSQIGLGYDFWRNHLSQLSVLQLNLSEMRSFLAEGGRLPSLSTIVKKLTSDRITAVMTLNKFGAICTYKDLADSVILAWPFELEDFVDATGAGDAFGAGIVSRISQRNGLSFGKLFGAICEGRIWAAYACRHLGGSAKCPDKKTLHEFGERLSRAGDYPVEVKDNSAAKEIFRMLDKIY